MLTTRQIDTFIEQHQLPEEFVQVITEHYLHVAQILAGLKRDTQPLIVGINGAQGTGKSTLASFLQLALENHQLLNRQGYNQGNIAVLSLDDFYLTKTERETLSVEVHPLLVTRGVPGTHDVTLLQSTLSKLLTLKKGESVKTPTFNKVVDDRRRTSEGKTITGPVDLIILEGWCVGSKPQEPEALALPVNNLERAEDKDQLWRNYANDQLANSYAKIFARLDYLILLQAPSMDSVFRWRTLQEEKLLLESPRSSIMHKEEMEYFLMHYERITRENLKTLPAVADLVLLLDENHQCVKRSQRIN